ncbi:MAG: hypothetical protein HC819_21060 [Cyclobacteriaceae bacterium]|nr:hypothetical protein [Cyclobacteriaceae bacterium]
MCYDLDDLQEEIARFHPIGCAIIKYHPFGKIKLLYEIVNFKVSKMITMNLAVKKIELINWLTKQDEAMINKIDNLRKSSIEKVYSSRMSDSLGSKLKRSESDIKAGRMHSQDEVESYFNSKFGQ